MRGIRPKALRKQPTAKPVTLICFALAVTALASASRSGASPMPLSVPNAIADETLEVSVALPASLIAVSRAADGVSWLHGDAADNRIDGDSQDNVLDGYAGRDVLHGFAGADHIFGGEGDDVLIGGRGDDVLSGGAGNDRVGGGEGSDLLSGGAGDDLLDGGPGDDTYLFEQGFGHDIVRARAREHAGHDVLVFKHLNASDAGLERSGDDLTVSDPQHRDSVRVVGYFAAEPHSAEALRFADGWTVNLGSLTEGTRVLGRAAD